jgi:hypothetical protein
MQDGGNVPPNYSCPSVTASSVTFWVFGDESTTEGTGPDNYRVQGGIWVKAEGMEVVRGELARLSPAPRRKGELKWRGLRGNRLRYRPQGFINLFFEGLARQFLSFDCIVVRHGADQAYGASAATRDLAVYKTWYTLLNNRLPAGSNSIITLDERRIRPGAEGELRTCLNYAGAWRSPAFTVTACHAVSSHSEELIQLTDLLCGAVAWDWNGRPHRNKAKRDAHKLICDHLGKNTLRRATFRDPKFGIWLYQPRAPQPPSIEPQVRLSS